MAMSGNNYSKREILTALARAIPGNKIIAYALVAQYTYLRPNILSTEKYDILDSNPDVAVFWNWTLNDSSISDEEREVWGEKYGRGQVGWNPGTIINRDLYEDRSTGRLRDFDFDISKDEDKGLLGLGLYGI